MSARRTQRFRAFSLLELMVALTIGGLAISSIYAIGSASGRIFQVQQRVAATQGSLRMAIDQVKRDIARAGFLATASAGMAEELCEPINPALHTPAGLGSFAGISNFQNNIAINAGNTNLSIDPTGNNAANGFSVDSLTLVGNYVTNSEYSGLTADGASPNSVRIQRNWYAYARDFTNWSVPANPNLAQTLVGEVWVPGRAVRIQTATRKRFFTTIQAVNDTAGQDLQLTLTDNLGGCLADVSGGWIAPLATLRYDVVDATGDRAERFAGTDGLVGLLMRTEVQPAAKTTPLAGVPNQQRVVLDHVVSFNLHFTMNQAGSNPGDPDVYNVGNWLDPQDATPASRLAAQAAVNANPELVRAVRITLAARTPLQDPRFAWTQAGCADMRCFQVLADPGAARVRWLQAEVFVPNIAYEGY